jgi:hypothetical protein
MAASFDICGHLTPVIDAGVESANFVAIEVIGGKDLDVAEAAIDGVFAKAPKHAGKEAADKQQSGDASTNHEESHHCAAAVAEDVAKGEEKKLSHG